MNLFYAPDIAQTSELPEDESLHCVKVLRLREGDPVTVIDGKGMFYYSEIEFAHPKHCRVRIIRQEKESSVRKGRLHIAIAPTKNIDRIEWFLEKVVEIGIDEITLLRCRYSERKEVKYDRLQKIVVSAMKQSLKATLPLFNPMTDIQMFLAAPREGLLAIGHCHKTIPRRYLKEYYQEGAPLTMLIGPEGDFSEEEVELAIQKGYQPVSLGESRLRTETAGLMVATTFCVLNLAAD